MIGIPKWIIRVSCISPESSMIYITQTFKMFILYLKGLHLTIDGWRPNCDDDGWRVASKHLFNKSNVLWTNDKDLWKGYPAKV